MRNRFQPIRQVDNDQLWADMREQARSLCLRTLTGPIEYAGPTAYAKVADLLRLGPPDDFVSLLSHFALPLGARRCLDGAGCLRQVQGNTAADLMLEKAQAFGLAQYHATQSAWVATATLFDRLSGLEARIVDVL